MERLKHRWRNIPTPIRKPIVTVVGIVFMLAAVATGWLPGPGGIPLFLIGIAILATEYAWAERLRDRVLTWIHVAGIWFKAHRAIGILLIVLAVSCVATATYLLYFR